jgi:methionyl-tRNA formyltransferase
MKQQPPSLPINLQLRSRKWPNPLRLPLPGKEKKMRKLRVALFALNGIGSIVFEALHPFVDIVGLWTRKEPNKHPHFRINDVNVLANAKRVPVHYEHEPFDSGVYVDLLLSATYHKKILKEHRRHASMAINIHQSLLPRHRGKNPFTAVIEANDVESGVTAHHLNDGWDTGHIIEQWPCGIENLDEGEVREKLGKLTAHMAVYIAHNFIKINQNTIIIRSDGHELSESNNEGRNNPTTKITAG